MTGLCCNHAGGDEASGSFKEYRLLHPAVRKDDQFEIDWALRYLDLYGLQFSQARELKSSLPEVLMRLSVIELKKQTGEIFLLDIASLEAGGGARKSFTKRSSEGEITTAITKAKRFTLDKDTSTALRGILTKLEKIPSGVESGYEMRHDITNWLLLEILLPKSFKVFMSYDYQALTVWRETVALMQQMCVVD